MVANLALLPVRTQFKGPAPRTCEYIGLYVWDITRESHDWHMNVIVYSWKPATQPAKTEGERVFVHDPMIHERVNSEKNV